MSFRNPHFQLYQSPQRLPHFTTGEKRRWWVVKFEYAAFTFDSKEDAAEFLLTEPNKALQELWKQPVLKGIRNCCWVLENPLCLQFRYHRDALELASAWEFAFLRWDWYRMRIPTMHRLFWECSAPFVEQVSKLIGESRGDERMRAVALANLYVRDLNDQMGVQ